MPGEQAIVLTVGYPANMAENLENPRLFRAGSVKTREAAESRGDERKKQLLEAEGGCLTATEVAERLGITRQGVDKRRSQGKLLAVTHYKRGYLYPKWQFGVEGFEKVLEALSDEDSWIKMIFMLSAVPRFEGETPLQLLRQGCLEEVLRFAETWGDTTAL